MAREIQRGSCQVIERVGTAAILGQIVRTRVELPRFEIEDPAV